MKISTNDEELITLSKEQLKVIKNDIPRDILEDELKRRLAYIVSHKYERCLERLKTEWIPRLKKKGVESIPVCDKAFINLVMSQEDYKDRQDRMESQELDVLTHEKVQLRKTISMYKNTGK